MGLSAMPEYLSAALRSESPNGYVLSASQTKLINALQSHLDNGEYCDYLKSNRLLTSCVRPAESAKTRQIEFNVVDSNDLQTIKVKTNGLHRTYLGQAHCFREERERRITCTLPFGTDDATKHCRIQIQDGWRCRPEKFDHVCYSGPYVGQGCGIVHNRIYY